MGDKRRFLDVVTIFVAEQDRIGQYFWTNGKIIRKITDTDINGPLVIAVECVSGFKIAIKKTPLKLLKYTFSFRVFFYE